MAISSFSAAPIPLLKVKRFTRLHPTTPSPTSRRLRSSSSSRSYWSRATICPPATCWKFIAYARANQSKMQFGSAGPASGSYLTCTYLNSAIGVTVTPVPYRGAPQGLQDLMAGRIVYYCPVTAAAIGHIENKTMKAIAILSRDRSPMLPALASAHEQGLVDFEANYWNGLFLPKGTPEPIIQKLHDAVV